MLKNNVLFFLIELFVVHLQRYCSSIENKSCRMFCIIARRNVKTNKAFAPSVHSGVMNFKIQNYNESK